MKPADDVAWRVSTHLGPDGEVRWRHAFRDLSGHIAQALCEQTTFTEQLEPDDQSARLCPLCWLFFGTDLAARQETAAAAAVRQAGEVMELGHEWDREKADQQEHERREREREEQEKQGNG